MMEFKDLPHSIQEIAAHTLRQRLNEAGTESVTKEDIDNMARNVRDAFTELYSGAVTDNYDAEVVAKKIASSLGFYVKEKYSKKEFWKTAKKIAERELLSPVANGSFYEENYSDDTGLPELLSLLEKFGIIMKGTALADFAYSMMATDGKPFPPELKITPGNHPRVTIRAIENYWFNPVQQ
ncbi:hypothetical protein [Escherichia coli]